MRHQAVASLVVLVGALSCASSSDDAAPIAPTPWVYDLPPGYPAPKVPDENPLTVEKATLGRALFFDRQLSGNGTQSCADCHHADKGFADGLMVSEGSTGAHTARNSQGLLNAAYGTTLTWANPLLTTLEAQIKVPLFGEFPVELGVTGHERLVLDRLIDDPRYGPLWEAAFPGQAIDFDRVIDALASFVRTLVSFDSPFDRYSLKGDASALTDAQRRGLDLFFGERAECFHCHGGFNFTEASTHNGITLPGSGFFNNGLYNVDGQGAYPPGNQGLIEFTDREQDMGRFRAPSLRNVALTAPYMHDGSIATLEEVVRHYEAGGRLTTEGPLAGDGRNNPYKSQFVRGFELTDQERSDLVAFLGSLTDTTFATLRSPFDDEPTRASPAQ